MSLNATIIVKDSTQMITLWYVHGCLASCRFMRNLLVKLFGDIHLQTLYFEDVKFTYSMLYSELHFGSNLSVIRESLKLPKN